ncbi:MAG: helix-turn-helix transcriptional regulator [Sphingomonas sp.]|uniref:response regulator transcription factor n=1 Tax=Sphingomonas sp. TaxID=28214 RepID=UPI0012081ADF|nr:helix-turn-helix domain-containing protein [Sphingomonas sp.]THD38308.1 MAG: helix-turn-helix transcriptional regulator [Sphingomonas sp.]
MEESRVCVLSPRERECLLLVGKGKTAGVIANAIGISENTVNGYIASGMAKLGAATRREAGYVVLEHERAGPQFQADLNLRVADSYRSPAFEPGRFSDDDKGSGAAASRDEGSKRVAGTGLRPLKTLALIAVILAALLIVVSAIKPLVEGGREIANMVQPGRPH